jgi:Fe-S cluster biosynthesis and repair protein YggX
MANSLPTIIVATAAVVMSYAIVISQGAAQLLVRHRNIKVPQEFIRMAHMVFDTRFKAEMEGLDEPPFDSDFGQKIFKNVSKKSWGEWVERQKMLLNEYRLQPWTREAQEFLVEQMNDFFFGEGGSLPKEFVAPTQ